MNAARGFRGTTHGRSEPTLSPTSRAVGHPFPPASLLEIEGVAPGNGGISSPLSVFLNNNLCWF